MVSKFRCSGACSIQTHMEQGLSLCPDFVVQGTHENKLTMKISQITACVFVVMCKSILNMKQNGVLSKEV